MTDGQSRRRTLRSLGAIGLAAVAGCLGDDDEADGDNGGDGVSDDGETGTDADDDGEGDGDAGADEDGGDEDGGDEDGGDEDGADEDGADDHEGDGGGDGSDRSVEEVIVGPDGDYSYDPDPLEIEPGTTVRWIWESNNHNVRPTSIPSDAEWEGHEPLENAGFEYEYAFQIEGLYEYVCDPHASAGMTGEIVVEE